MNWVTPELLDALRMVESSGRNNAVSKAGAVGEYQFMPQFVGDMGYGVKPFDPLNPTQARKAAKDYLLGMQKHHNFTPTQALQAYNWGPGNMKKYLKGDIKTMPTETTDYVDKFSQFGWSPDKVKDKPPVARVPKTDVVPPPEPSQSFVSEDIPQVEQVPQVEDRHKKMISDPSRSYQVVKGDTLYSIAREHGMTVEQIASHNGIEDVDYIQAGQTIQLVPSIRGLTPSGESSSGRQEYDVMDKVPPKDKDMVKSFIDRIFGD
tara:strand:+ start:95 stop:883 length:789 start_codon:yes stop_codon:yes gene_type:complete